MGRLTRDPELRHTQQGTPVTSFTIAVDRAFSGKDGGEKQTDFIDIVSWKQTAEFVVKYFTKGQLIAVEGRLQIRDWTDKDGNKRRNAEVVTEQVHFTGDRGKSGNNGEYRSDGLTGGSANSTFGSANGGYTSPVQGSGFMDIADDEGDLPF